MSAPSSKGVTFAYTATPYNSTLFTQCCRVAVMPLRFGGGLEDCPSCGRTVATLAPHREGR